MHGRAGLLGELVEGQLRRLCAVVGLPPTAPLDGVRALLDPIGERALREPALWPTDISDDHTPVEFSVAVDAAGPPTLRLLAERLAGSPSRQANLQAALNLVDALATRFDLTLDRFERARQVLLGDRLRSDFGLWFSMVFRRAQSPDLKVYFNPDAQGRARAPELVAEALRRLGLERAYAVALAHGVRPGQLNRLDRFSFFALDLHARPQSRVKLYVAHRDADGETLVRAARAVADIDDTGVRDLLRLTGCAGRLAKRPAMSGYTFLAGDTDRPSTSSLYLPIRDYVDDDAQARRRVLAVLDHFGLDTAVIDEAIDAVARRPLRAGVGLIAHVSVKLTAHGAPGATVYLSSEAYRASLPRRPMRIPAQLGR